MTDWMKYGTEGGEEMSDKIKVLTTLEITKDQAEDIARKIGWTPPEPKWTPKEGELVQLHIHNDEWIATTYRNNLHFQSTKRGECRPHPTHIKEEAGPKPDAVSGITKWMEAVTADGKRLMYDLRGDSGRWFWLEEE